MIIEKKYLALPYNNHMATKKVYFYEENTLKFDLKIKLDFYNPECFAYINVERFIGKSINILYTSASFSENNIDFYEKIDENINFPNIPFQIDSIPENDADKKRRPYIHFTTPYGWLGDPNGLVYADGIYHMFYQLNPAGLEKENMHWGHAISRDLLSWQNLDIALSPDEKGFMFSGGGIVDKGKLIEAKNGYSPILLFYTSAGDTSILSKGEPFAVCMAYSQDGGKTFIKYPGNPILPNIARHNRDPKVVWCEQMGKYIMALYLEKSRYCLLSSENLTDWKVFQVFHLPGDSECPDLFQVCFDSDPKNNYWVFCGGSDHYYVGKFQDGLFVSSQTTKKLHYGKNSYAAHTFTNLPNGRAVRLSWQRIELEGAGFRGQISMPTELKLVTIENEIYLCLWPIEEIDKIARNYKIFDKILLSNEDSFVQTVPRGAIDVYLETEYAPDTVLNMEILGVNVTCDMVKNQLLCSGSVCPLTIRQKKLRLRLILDKNSIEIFVDEGQFYMSNAVTCDHNLNYIHLKANNSFVVKTLSVAQLQLEEI